MNIYVSDNTIRRLYWAVLALDAFLVVMTALSDLHVPCATSKLAAQADLKQEGVFAVWYSSLLLLLDSVAALCIAHSGSTRETQAPVFRWTWTAAALCFLGLSIDETAQIHERAGYVFSLVVGRIHGLTDQYVAFGWLVLFSPLIIAFTAGMLVTARTWLAFHPVSRFLALVGIACWVSVIFAEFLEAQVHRYGGEVGLLGAFEEGSEIIGATCFLFSFIEYLKTCSARSARARSRDIYRHARAVR